MYRVGFPGWKLAAKMGIPLLVKVNAYYDKESNSYWASSPDLDGLIVSGADLDELHTEINAAASDLLMLAIDSRKTTAKTELRFRDTALCAV